MPLPNFEYTPMSFYLPARDGQYVLGYFPEEEVTLLTLPVVAWDVEPGESEATPVLGGIRWDSEAFPWICHGANSFVHFYDEVVFTSLDQVVEYENKKLHKRPQTKLHPGAAWPDFSGAFPR
jgi:hypothetical protein